MDGFDFVAADALIEFANNNNMEVAGHTLVWHSQTPNWVFEGTRQPDENAKAVNPEDKELTVSPPRTPGANGPNAAGPVGPLVRQVRLVHGPAEVMEVLDLEDFADLT